MEPYNRPLIKAMVLQARNRAEAAGVNKSQWRPHFKQLPDFDRLVRIGMLTDDCCDWVAGKPTSEQSEGYI